MKVYLSVDMEGIAGGQPSGPTGSGHARYPAAVDLMVGETNAAIEGALAAGAGDILVNDSHGGMYNLVPAALHPAARVLQGQKAWSMVHGAGPDAGFDVALFVGYHARAGHGRGTIAHTYSLAPVETRLDGRPTGEYGLNAMILGPGGSRSVSWPVTTRWPRRSPSGCRGPSGSWSRPRPAERGGLDPSDRGGRADPAGCGRRRPFRGGRPSRAPAGRTAGRHRGRLQPRCRGGPRRDRAGRRTRRRSRCPVRLGRSGDRLSRLPGGQPAGVDRRSVTRPVDASPAARASGPYCAETTRHAGGPGGGEGSRCH